MNQAEVQSRFGRALQSQRKQLGLTQAQLAARCGLQRTYISDVERGARNLSLLAIAQLAKGLKISIASFFQPPPPGPAGGT